MRKLRSIGRCRPIVQSRETGQSGAMRTKPHGRSLRTARERSRRSEGLIKIREDRSRGLLGATKIGTRPASTSPRGTRGPHRNAKNGYGRVEVTSLGSVSPVLLMTYRDPQIVPVMKTKPCMPMLWAELACTTVDACTMGARTECATRHAKPKAMGSWGMGRRTDYPSSVRAESSPFA